MAAVPKIVPVLWFDHQAEEAVNFYISLFKNSRITEIVRTAAETPSGNEIGSVLTVGFELAGQEFGALNGGPYFTFNPSVSLFVNCDTAAEVDTLFARLADGGSVLMPLEAYPFSEKFGWVKDKYGLSWQINLGSRPQKITPFLLFVGDQNGKAEKALKFYTSLFDGGRIERIERYLEDEEGGTPGSVKHAVFYLGAQEFMAMDSALEHDFTFNEAISFMIVCRTQQEVDYFWEKLTAHPEAEQCGWLKDKYGVSWQVTPAELLEMMKTPDPEKARRVTEAFLPMKKLDLEVLRKAYAEV